MATLVCRGLQSCLDPHLVQEPMTTLRFKLVSSKTTANHQSLARSLLDLTSPSPPHCHPLPQQILEDPKPIHHPHPHPHHHHHHNHHHHHPISSSSSSSNPHLGPGLGGWSFLHSLTTTSYREPSTRPDQEPPAYVHPLARASSLRLSPRSLELCTENLGSESSNIVPFADDDDDDDGDPRDESKSARREQAAPRTWPTRQIMNVDNVSKKAKPRTNINNSSNSSSFPPPLTTIANDSIRVRPHREDGRLILEAVRAPQENRSCLHAERSHGRLRLCFFKDESPLCFDSGDERDDGEEKDVEARTIEGDTENETAESDVEEEGGGVGEELLLVDEEDEDEEEEEEEEETEQDGDGDDWEEEGMEGSDGIVGGKVGMEMLHHRHRHRHRQRPSWCKGGGGGNEHKSNKRLCNLEVILAAF